MALTDEWYTRKRLELFADGVDEEKLKIYQDEVERQRKRNKKVWNLNKEKKDGIAKIFKPTNKQRIPFFIILITFFSILIFITLILEHMNG